MRTSRTKLFFLVTQCLWLIPTTGAAKTLSLDEMLRRVDEARGPSGDISFRVEVKDYNKGAFLRKNIYRVFSKDGKYVLVESEFPERLQGRKLLMRDEDLWLYLPTVKQPTRIGLQQRLTGEVSNGDLAKTSFHEAYEPKLLGSETLKGKTYYKLLLTARSKSCTYRQIKLWVNALNFQPARAEYMAISGKRMKSSEYFTPKAILGSTRMTQVIIQDAIDSSRQSKLKYYDYRRENLDASFFSKESLP